MLQSRVYGKFPIDQGSKGSCSPLELQKKRYIWHQSWHLLSGGPDAGRVKLPPPPIGPLFFMCTQSMKRPCQPQKPLFSVHFASKLLYLLSLMPFCMSSSILSLAKPARYGVNRILWENMIIRA